MTESPQTSIDSLPLPVNAPRFLRDLDAKLQAAVTKIVAKETVLDRAITLASEERNRRGQVLTGRQALYLLYREYDLNPHMGIAYGMMDLTSVKFRGDDKIRQLLMEWSEKVAGLSTRLPDETLAELL